MTQLNYDYFKSICKDSGLKATSQRFIIYKTLVEEAAHPTADQLYESVSPNLPGLSRDTVYRTLNMLADCGLAIRLVMPGGATHFDGDVSRHYHFLCDSCGRIYDFYWPAVGQLPWPPEAWEIGRPRQTSVLILGTCHSCPAPAAEPM